MNYFDLHCDTLLKLKNNEKDRAVYKTDCFKSYCQVFSLFIEETDKYPFDTYRELINIAKENKNIKYLSLENAIAIGNDLSRVEILKNDGIKSIMLTWNGENIYAGGALSNGNLTELGKCLIKKMNEQKIALDVSHLNEKSFFEAIKYADIVLASHSNCNGVFNHKRNLSDKQIKAIIQKNGIIGINFYPLFLGGEVFQKIYENIIYILNLKGENNICFGSDFDGAKMDKKLRNIEQVKDLYKFLKNQGLSKELLNRIFYENAKNFYRNF